MRYHLIGICGAGMSAVAKLLIDKGETVTGSDEGFYPPISDYLKENNISCLSPHKKENIPKNVDFIVIGKHAKLNKEENEEVREAFDSGKKILSFPQVLENHTKDREKFVVVGSHGKSTCTALISWCLLKNNVDVGYFIGALPITPKENAHVGQAKEFILEGDEYPSSNWDITSKFLYYHPDNLLLTALAHDHVNVFKNHEDYIKPFFQLISQTKGKVVVCLDDETISSKLNIFPKDIVTYGLSKNAKWRAENIKWGIETSFDLVKDDEKIIEIKTTLLGKHNIQNVVGISAILLETNKLTKEQLANGIKTFKGIVRRLDKKSNRTKIPIYEGFGSSYEKARSAIEAIKLHFTEHTLIIVFEPHTFSWRNRDALSWYDSVFSGAKKVYIYKPPEHGKNTHEQLTPEEIRDRIEKTKTPVSSFEDKNLLANEISKNTEEKDVILILSSGNLDGALPQIIKNIEEKFPI